MSTAIDDQEVDLRAIFLRIWVRRWWIIASMVLFLSAFIGTSFLMTPIYRASALLISASDDRSNMNGALGSTLSQLGGLASLAGVRLGTESSETEESLAVLKSRQFTEAFIDDETLMPKLFEKKWDSIKKGWKSPESDRPTPAKAYRYFDKEIRSVVQDKKTGLIAIQIDWRDRIEAASWASELVRRLNAEMRRRAIDKAEASIGFLRKELEGTNDIGTREAINRLIEVQIKQRMLANVTQEYAFRIVDKAMPPDVDDLLRPKRVLLAALGALLGLFVGVMFVIIYPSSRA